MRVTFCVFLFCLLNSFTAYSQKDVGRDPQGISSRANGRNYQLDFDLTLQKMLRNHNANKRGNFDLNTEPFLFKGWEKNLFIYTKQGKKFMVKESNYHVKNDYFVSKISKDSVYIWDDSNVDVFILGDKKFKNFNNSFYNVLNSDTKKESKALFLKKFTTYKINSSEENPLVIPSKKDRMKLSKSYYLMYKGVVRKVKLNKKRLLNILKSNDDVLLNYAKNKKLSFKKEKDVVKIIDYYNSL